MDVGYSFGVGVGGGLGASEGTELRLGVSEGCLDGTVMILGSRLGDSDGSEARDTLSADTDLESMHSQQTSRCGHSLLPGAIPPGFPTLLH